jgi:putative redox protein
MGDWRTVEAVWQSGNVFNGINKTGIQVIMGSPEGFSPMELLLISLAGCTGMDIVSILEKKRQPLHALKILVRGLRREDYPRIYTELEVEYQLYGNSLDARAVEQAISLSREKYCSVSAMLGQAAILRTSFVILAEKDVTQA